MVNFPIQVSLDVNHAIEQFSEGVIGSITQPIKDIFDYAFMGLRFSTEKRRIEYQNNLIDFSNKIRENLQQIPEDSRKEPDMSIIGPAIESSKYFIDEPELRNMFAKLLGSSFDKQKEDVVHPSFPQIIQNLSPIDAEFLSAISTDSVFPFCTIRLQKREKSNFTQFFSTVHEGITLCRFIVNITDKNDPLHDFNSNIDNLSRLKLIEIVKDQSFTDANHYLPFIDHPIYNHYLDKYRNNESILDEQVTLIKGIIAITNFGKNFINACVI